LSQLGKELFLGKPAQAACQWQQRCPPVKPHVGAVLLGFFINTQQKLKICGMFRTPQRCLAFGSENASLEAFWASFSSTDLITSYKK
jgi:hypothetical protein